jgi:hypothetical protein
LRAEDTVAVYSLDIQFTRDQLVKPDYDPIQNDDVDIEDLRARYEGSVALEHAAAIRGILVLAAEGREWKWLWGVGLLHDETVAVAEYPRLFARYRNQYPTMPRIEFDDEADVFAALQLLLDSTPIQIDDPINIEARYKRASSVREYLEQ